MTTPRAAIAPDDFYTLSFELIDEIEQMFGNATRADLLDLVMILPQPAGAPLAVYNRSSPPDSVRQPWQATRLSDLSDADILAHEGLIIGWSALDVFFPSLVPYGPDFYNIRWLFWKLNQVELGLEAAHRLSRTIWERCQDKTRSDEKRHLCQVRIIQFGVPHLLSSKERVGLLGMQIPSLDALHQGTERIRLYYLKDLRSRLRSEPESMEQFRPTHEDWLVGMPELRDFFPHVDPHHPRFLNLRPIFHAAQWFGELRGTIHQLSSHAWEKWGETGDEAWLRKAYALATEYRFDQEDATTLVGLRPDNDFGRFRKLGRAQRYVRAPLIFMGASAESGGVHPVVELRNEHARPKGFNRIVISTPVLREDMRAEDGRWIDLRVLLLKAGKKYELARMLWLFARDLLPPLPREDWEGLRAARNLDAAMDMLLLSYHFYNLLDPWQWRGGRYPIFARWNFQAVVSTLETLISLERERGDDTEHYTRALLAWYQCGGIPDEDISEQIAMMVEQSKRFLGSARSHQYPQRQRVAEIFIDLGNYLLDPSVARPPSHILDLGRNTSGLFQHLNRLIQQREFYDHLSPLFVRALERYHVLRRQWHALRQGLEGGRSPARYALQELVNDYDALARTSYALRHENAILHWLYMRDREQIETLLEALAAGPIIQVQALNPWVIRGRVEEVTVKVANIGGDTAHHFMLNVQNPKEVSFIRSTLQPPMEDLNAGEERFWRWRIRTDEERLTLRLHYRYKDYLGALHDREAPLTIPVRGRRSQIPLIIANPYRAGTPVYGQGLFFGRESLLREVFSRLLSGNTQPILLRGPRRIGKTSILRQIEWLMEKWDRLESIGFDREQLSSIQRHLLVSASLQAVDTQRPDYVKIFFESLLKDIRAQAGIRESLGRYQRIMQANPVHEFRRLLSEWIEKYIQSPVIILLDEWDEVYREEYRPLARNLRALIESRQLEHVNWVISSTWVLAREVAQFGSPFYNQTLTLEVGSLNWDAARKLVILPSDRIGIDWQGEAVVSVLEQTGRRPYLIQLACSKTLDELARNESARKDGLITVRLLQQAIGGILQDAQSSDQYFGFLWEKTAEPSIGGDSVNWMGRLILWVLTQRYPDPVSRIEIIDSIEAAFRERSFSPIPKDFFEQTFKNQMLLLHRIFDAIAEQGGRYTISIPLVYTWLRDRLRIVADEKDLIAQMYQGLQDDYAVWREKQGGGQ